MKKLIISMFIIFSFGLQAKEVDQFMAWDANLADSTGQVSDFYNDLIKNFVEEKKHIVGKGGPTACGWMVFKLSIHINGVYDKNTLAFFKGNKEISAFPSWDKSYEEIYEQSIFRDVPMFHPDLSRVIKLNGIYIGTDKIAHFFGMGFLYWIKYRGIYKKNKKRLGHEVAHLKAVNKTILFGVKSEKGVIGWKTQETASFADLEANYQGLRFLNNFCMGDDPMIKVEAVNGKKKWVVTRPFDLKNYVNPWWDESFYSNLYTPEGLELIKPHMLKYCKKRKSNSVQSNFNFYRTNFKPSYSVKFLKKLIEKRELEDNYKHSLDYVCEELERDEINHQEP